MNLSTSAIASCSAGLLPEIERVATWKVMPPVASSRLVKRTRSPLGDHSGALYSTRGVPKGLGLDPSRSMTRRLGLPALESSGRLANSNEDASGAQFRSLHICPLGLAATMPACLPSAAT